MPTPKDAERVFRERFAELKAPMRPEEGAVEAARCLYCYDAPCVRACPAHIEVPRFIKQLASRDVAGAARTILEANALGHSCARVCPVEVLCEGACVYHAWHKKPIEIGRLQRFATDLHYASGRRLFEPGRSVAKPVAVIGSGPAGLACAWYLRRLGHPVTILERQEVPGGLNAHGVAEYKMDQRTAVEEAGKLLELGARLELGVEVGKDLPCDALDRDFAAVFVGVGLGGTHFLRVPGEDLPGVWDALSFIYHIKRRDLAPIGESKVAVVIGGGNTAIDAVTQSKRAGTETVIMAYRRGPRQRPAYDFEFELAKSDEARFLWFAAPAAILGEGKVEGVRFQRTRLAAGGRVEPVPGEFFEVACDRVIKAIGQSSHLALAKAARLDVDEKGRIVADPVTLATSRARWYAGGDAINGGKEVVNASADGKKAAWRIHQALTGAKEPSAADAAWVRSIDAARLAPVPDPALARPPAGVEQRGARSAAPRGGRASGGRARGAHFRA